MGIIKSLFNHLIFQASGGKNQAFIKSIKLLKRAFITGINLRV
jgi:hypothetical protein